jgi:O-antigen/teichoic acid export membrane protein
MNKYLRAVSTNFVFFFISTIFFLVATPIAIKVMGAEFYGLWAILTALMMFSNLGAAGIDTIVMKFSSEAIAEGEIVDQYDRLMTAGYCIVLAMAVLAAVSLLLARNFIAENLHAGPEYTAQFRVAIVWVAAGLFPQFLSRVSQGYLNGQLQFRATRSIELISTVFLWGGVILIALMKKNLVLIAAWSFVGNLVTLGLYGWVLRRQRLHLRGLPHLPTLVRMLRFSGWMFLQSVAIALFQQFDRIIVGLTLGPALAGVYSVGTSVGLRLTIVVGQITQVMVPYASSKDTSGEREKLYKTFRQLSQYVSLLLAVTSGLLILWMNEILSLWISPDYSTQYANAFRVLIVAYSLLSLCRPAHQTITGIDKVKFSSLVYLFTALLMLLGVYFLSRTSGLLGAVAANLTMAILLVFNLFVYRKLNPPIHWREVIVDLRWGVISPIFVYGLNLYLPHLSILDKSMVTLVLCGLIVWVMARDQILRSRLSQMVLPRTGSKKPG